jgi:hypothetical protein
MWIIKQSVNCKESRKRYTNLHTPENMSVFALDVSCYAVLFQLMLQGVKVWKAAFMIDEF